MTQCKLLGFHYAQYLGLLLRHKGVSLCNGTDRRILFLYVVRGSSHVEGIHCHLNTEVG